MELAERQANYEIRIKKQALYNAYIYYGINYYGNRSCDKITMELGPVT